MKSKCFRPCQVANKRQGFQKRDVHHRCFLSSFVETQVSAERGPEDDPWNLLFGLGPSEDAIIFGLNHVETPWMQRNCPIFFDTGGMSCIPCQRSCLFKAGKIITKKARYWNVFFEISAWSSFQKERCEEKRLDHVEDQDSDEDRSWRSLMTM